MQTQFEHDTSQHLTEINMPTLVMEGDGDRFVPFEKSNILEERIPETKLVIYKNAGY